MGQWARIEAPMAAAPEAAPSAGTNTTTNAMAGTAASARPPARLKRDERIVLGSIDAGAQVFQRNGREAILGGAVFLVPTIIANLVLSTVLFDRFESFSDSTVSIPELVGNVDAATGADTVLAYVSILTSALAAALAGGYLAALYADVTFGNGASLRRDLRFTLRKLPALFAAWAVGHVWFLLGALVVVRARGSALFGWLVVFVPAGLVLAAVVVLVSPVIVIERRGPIAGLRRAIRLARMRFGACLGFVLGAGAVGLVLRSGITALPRLAESTGFVTFGSWGGLVEGVAGQVAQLLMIPIVGLATAAFYLQLRVHAEGLDLRLAADRAFPDRSGG